MDFPFVSVIVPTCNREEPLCKALQALFNQDYPNYEVIVVDQTRQHAPQTLSFLESNRDKFRHYHLDETAGLPSARNFGVRQAKGEIILFCDDDVITRRDFIKYHAANYEAPQVGGVVGKIESTRQEQQPFALFELKIVGGKVVLSGRYLCNWNTDEKKYVFSGRGANMSFRKDLFYKVGGFDPSFIGTHSYEDVDFSYRLRDIGANIIYEPQALATHQFYPTGGCRLDYKVKAEYFRFHNAMLFYLKNMNKFFLPYMLTIFFLIAIKKILIPTKSLKNFLYVLKGLWDGFRTYAVR